MGVIILKNKQIVEVCVQYLSSAEYIGANIYLITYTLLWPPTCFASCWLTRAFGQLKRPMRLIRALIAEWTNQ